MGLGKKTKKKKKRLQLSDPSETINKPFQKYLPQKPPRIPSQRRTEKIFTALLFSHNIQNQIMMYKPKNEYIYN